MYVACTNCEDTKEVKLRNELGQIYEIRKCPLCICKVCGDTGTTEGPGPWLSRPCWMCGPQRFSAHVRAYKKHMHPKIVITVKPGELPILRDRWESFLMVEPEPTIFQSFINWIKSLCK